MCDRMSIFFSLNYNILVVTVAGLDSPLTCQRMSGTGRPDAVHENRASRPSRTVIRICSGEWEMIRGGTKIDK